MTYPTLRFSDKRTIEHIESKSSLAIIEQRKSLHAFRNADDARRNSWLASHDFIVFRVHVIVDITVTPNTSKVFYTLEAWMKGNPKVKNFETLNYRKAEAKYKEYEKLFKQRNLGEVT